MFGLCPLHCHYCKNYLSAKGFAAWILHWSSVWKEELWGSSCQECVCRWACKEPTDSPCVLHVERHGPVWDGVLALTSLGSRSLVQDLSCFHSRPFKRLSNDLKFCCLAFALLVPSLWVLRTDPESLSLLFLYVLSTWLHSPLLAYPSQSALSFSFILAFVLRSGSDFIFSLFIFRLT